MKCRKQVAGTFALSLVLLGCTGHLRVPAPDGDDDATSEPSDDDDGPGGKGRGGAGGTTTVDEERFAGATLVAVDRAVACDARSVRVTGSRRLSVTEYLRTVRDLFPGRALPALQLSADTVVFGFDNIDLFVSDSRVREYGAAAFAVAEAVTTGDLAALAGCDPAVPGCAETFVNGFAARAYRRPLLAEEKAPLVALFEAQRRAISPRAAVELTIAAILQTPQFLYRLETAGVGRNEPQRVIGHEMANRLSYLIWGSMPDAQLLAAAAAGKLDAPNGVEAEAKRMLEVRAASEQMSHFVEHWLHLDKLASETVDKNPTLFPQWSQPLAADAVEESRRFVGEVFAAPAGSFSDLLRSRKAQVKAGVSRLLNQDGAGQTWTSVELPAGQRAGILTRPAFLASTAKESWGSPPLRGVEVMRQVLCIRPLSPPPDIDLTVRESANPGEVLTNRARFEEKTTQGACRGCHRQIDGFGMPFEHYDAVGAYRDADAGKPVDASGTIVGVSETVDGPVGNAVELSEKLAGSEQALYCFGVNWTRFAQGTVEREDEWCQLDEMHDAVARAGGTLRGLLLATIGTPSFSQRHAD